MTKAQKVVVGIGAAAAIAGAVFLLGSHKDTPIEVADGSVKLKSAHKFDVTDSKHIAVSKYALLRAKKVEVWNGQGVKVEEIAVRRRGWTMTSADGSVSLERALHWWDDVVESVDVTSTNDFVMTNDDTEATVGAQFSTATLRFTDDKEMPQCLHPSGIVSRTCNLDCGAPNCTIIISYK